MKIISEENKIIFSNGKEVYANLGIIGLSPNNEIYYGYDGSLDNDFESENFSNEDRIELADYMVERWQEYKSIYLSTLLSQKTEKK